MNQALLKSYERELSRLREHGAWLARASPTRAGTMARLLDDDQDPFVKQLVEAFAYTLARLDLKLESERQQIPAAVLQFLHPVLTLPVPARTIVQFGWGEGQVPGEGKLIPLGSKLQVRLAEADFSAEGLGEFRTCQPCVVPPVRIEQAQLTSPTGTDGGRRRLRLVIAPAGRGQTRMADVRMSLPTGGGTARGSDGAAAHAAGDGAARRYGVRVFLGGVERGLSPLALYEALTRRPVEGELQVGERRIRLPDCVRPAGFEPDEALMPYDARQTEPLRLLAEYAVMREKFLFVDFTGLAPGLFADAGASATLDLLLDPESAGMIGGVHLPGMLKLGCVPVVNLESVAQARPLRRTTYEIELQPDPSEARDRELYTIDDVRATRNGEAELEYLPMFQPVPPSLALRRRHGGYWYTRRADRKEPGGGQDVLLSLTEFDGTRTPEAGLTLNATGLCFRRNVIGLTEGELLFAGEAEARAVSRLHLPVWPNLSGDVVLTLVEVLSCGTGLFGASEEARPAVVRLLNMFGSLYRGEGVPGLLDGEFITALETAPVAAGVREGIARGHEVRLATHAAGTSAHEVYLIARVLDQVLGAFAPAERFTKLSAVIREGNATRTLVSCPPRVGNLSLA